MKKLPDIETEGERIARDTHRTGNGTYLWTDLVGAVQTAISEERARHPDLRAAMDEYKRAFQSGFLHPYDPEITKYLEGVIGVVEANTFEKSELWMRYSKSASPDPNRAYTCFDWRSSTVGQGLEIGRLAEFPICLSLYVDVIDGHRVLFMHSTSMVTHNGLIRTWLMNVLPASAMRESGYPNMVDALNFTNVFPTRR